jgi:peptidoglycan hydrolase CwlO-like protein
MRTHPHPSVRTRAVLAAAALGLSAAMAVSSTAAADPIQDADATVEALRQEADRASQQYFDALTQAQELDAHIAELEGRLPELERRQRRLRHQAEDRAVAAYIRAGVQLAVLLDADDALSAARRRQWLDRLNAHDNDAFAKLVKASSEVQTQRKELREARTTHEALLAELDAAGRDIDAKLQAAVGRRAQLEAEAAAPAAATAPSATEGSGGGSGGGGGAEIPTAPPPGYVPTPGVHPYHDDPWMVCTRGHESGGNYAAVNPAGPYLGAYQFLQSMWNSGANHAGRTDLIGVPPHTASEYDQDDVAWAVYQWQGNGPWGGRC